MSGGRTAGKVGVGVAEAGGRVTVGVAEATVVAVGSMVRSGAGVDAGVAGVTTATPVAVGPTVHTGVGVGVGRVSVRTAKKAASTNARPPTRRTPSHPLDSSRRGPGRRTWLGRRRDDGRRSLLGRLLGTLEPDRVRRSRLIVASQTNSKDCSRAFHH